MCATSLSLDVQPVLPHQRPCVVRQERISRNHHALRFLAVLSFLGSFHGETSFRGVRRRHSLRMYLSEHTCRSVLCPVGTAEAREPHSERAQGGVESSSPSFFRRYYDNPPERPRQSVANGQRERSCGSSPFRREPRQDSSLPGENLKGRNVLM
jgi:hypothetical protein